jgi:predicted dehydrogenase
MKSPFFNISEDLSIFLSSPPKKPLRLAIIGAAKRSTQLYLPIIRGLKDFVIPVACWSRSRENAEKLGKTYGVPSYTDIRKMTSESGAEASVVCASYMANGLVGLEAVRNGLHSLLETPIAHDLSEADAIIASAKKNRLKVEVAEQYHLRPGYQLAQKLISDGLFGRVHTGFNDFACHGYHGVSLMRSVLGFDRNPTSANGLQADYPLSPYGHRYSPGIVKDKKERQEYGWIRFSSGQTGIFLWTDVGYEAPARSWMSLRFLGERGWGQVFDGEKFRFELASPKMNRSIPLRVIRKADKGILHSYEAVLDTKTVSLWKNPFYALQKKYGLRWDSDTIAVASTMVSLLEAIRSGNQPRYGGLQARTDQAVSLALSASARKEGRPVRLDQK